MWEQIFHYVEFWSAAMFNVITGVVLHNSISNTFHELASVNTSACTSQHCNIVCSNAFSLHRSRYFEAVSDQINYVGDFCITVGMGQHALHYNFN